MAEIHIPQQSLIVLVGVSGAGKSHFAARHFTGGEVISSDFCRLLVSDNENDQSASRDAFDVLHYIAATRLRRGLLTVIDATSVQPEPRRQLVALAKQHHILADAIVFDIDKNIAQERNADRADRDFGPHVIHRQHRELRRSMRGIKREGFRRVHVLESLEDINAATIVRDKAWSDKTELTGPFDLIGDVHGCRAELETLLNRLGYRIHRDDRQRPIGADHPEGRTCVFVGDLVDRGPDSPGVLRLVMGMAAAGTALCVAGNHEAKLAKALAGRKVKVAHGLEKSLEQLAEEPAEFTAQARRFIDGLISHYRLDGGRLVVAHAGLKESYHGRASNRVRSFALYGDTTGETDEYGLPVRYPWAEEYRGAATVVYGHTPVVTSEWINNTICLDTGCVFGGTLTGLRYPERALVSVPAEQTWYEPVRPLAPETPVRDPAALDYTDVGGTRIVETGLHGRIKIRAENSAAALEVAGRFAVDPRWMIYLPPTMPPGGTATDGDLLEHPERAFGQYQADGVDTVVCQEKHMGSRAVVVVCRDQAVAATRFGITDPAAGTVYTRTGRPFFTDPDSTRTLLDRLRTATNAAGLWETLHSDWYVLDAELLPWSVKAAGLIHFQYAPAGAAAAAALPAAGEALRAAAQRGLDVTKLLRHNDTREHNAEAFRQAYRRYCAPVTGLDGVTLAPFQILAAQGHNLARRDHDWHLAHLDRLAAADETGTLVTTGRIRVDLADPASRQAAVDWWTKLTAGGGEGMVVKPIQSVLRPGSGLVPPGLKVRGGEYLRIVYGPDYTEPGNLDRLRQRRLGRKRSLALREYALGIEALDRLAAGEPLWRVHEAVFAVLALESEPVDPRL